MEEEVPIVDSTYILEKFPGKGGWTYAHIPEIQQNSKNPFGWVQVRGFIDDYPLNHYKLMPQGDKKLFLPVKAAIRKKIKKQAGDEVRIQLFLEDRELGIPAEIMECLNAEPVQIKNAFIHLPKGKKKTYLDWIYEAKTLETKTERIVSMLKDLNNHN